MAKERGVPGWHSMRKAQLVRALVKLAKANEQVQKRTGGKANLLAPTGSSSKTSSRSRGRTARGESSGSESAIAKKVKRIRAQEEFLKNLAAIRPSTDSSLGPVDHDRVGLIVRDAYWVQVYWEISKASVQRAKAAFGNRWHKAQPVVRLLKVNSNGNRNSVEDFVRDESIHGGVNNWYVNVGASGGTTWRVAIGYVVDKQFHLIAKSNQVAMPTASKAEDFNWLDIASDPHQFYAMSGGQDATMVSADLKSIFEEKTRQPMQAPSFQRLGTAISTSNQTLSFNVNAHLVVYGNTDANADVTVGGDPVRVNPDGTFAVKMELPDKRQVLPVVACSRDGTRQRTTVLAIERNTKEMEPLNRDLDELDD